MNKRTRTLTVAIGFFSVVALLAAACSKSSGADVKAAPLDNPTTAAATTAPVSDPGTINATVQDMSIDLSTTSVPAGKVTFDVTNNGPSLHEFVVLATDTPAGDFKIGSFEGEEGRFDEDAKGLTNVGEAGEVQPGGTQTLTIKLPAGHYAVVCNLPGHYGAGMHQDLTVT